LTPRTSTGARWLAVGLGAAGAFWAASLLANLVDLRNGESGAGAGVVGAALLMPVLLYGAVHYALGARRTRALEVECEIAAIREPATATALHRVRVAAWAAILVGSALIVVYVMLGRHVTHPDGGPNLAGGVLIIPGSAGILSGTYLLFQRGHAVSVLRQHPWVRYDLPVLVRRRGRRWEVLTCVAEGEVLQLRSIRLRRDGWDRGGEVFVAGPAHGRWVIGDLTGAPTSNARPGVMSFTRRRWRRAWGSRGPGRAVDGSGR
jgi:hypothetical protein